MTTFVLVLLGVIAYLQIGFQLGRAGWKAWTGKCRSTAAFWLFPTSWGRDTVGSTESPSILAGINPPEGAYRTAMVVAWPCSLLWSTMVIGGLLGPSVLIDALRASKEEPSFEERCADSERQSRELDEEIWKLEAGDAANIRVSDGSGEPTAIDDEAERSRTNSST